MPRPILPKPPSIRSAKGPVDYDSLPLSCLNEINALQQSEVSFSELTGGGACNDGRELWDRQKKVWDVQTKLLDKLGR